MQTLRMVWQYIGLVLSFAFRRTTLAIDSLQVLAASAIPALANLAGLKMAPSIQNEALAYIGAIGIALVAIRLLSAPFFIWREQVGELAQLRLELSRPERMELKRLAKLKAKRKLRLAEAINDFNYAHFPRTDEEISFGSDKYAEIVSLARQLSLGSAFTIAVARLNSLGRIRQSGQMPSGYFPDMALTDDINRYLMGSITAEDLLLRLPPDTVPKTPQ